MLCVNYGSLINIDVMTTSRFRPPKGHVVHQTCIANCAADKLQQKYLKQEYYCANVNIKTVRIWTSYYKISVL